MDNSDGSIELRRLIETEIPEGRSGLESSYANLERVAAYCEANYTQAADKKAAFEETKRYTVQSLASVAYQVNTLASALLQTLDLQTEKIANMASQVHNVDAIIAIHKEKVARREIGVLTANKCMVKQAKIVTPHTQERPQRYQRTPIDYTVLDGLGHGVRSPEPPSSRSLISRAASTTSGGSSHYPVFPNYEQLLPKANINATLSRSSMNRGDHYRVPQIAAPPVIDPQRLSSLTQVASYGNSASANSNYSNVSSPRDTCVSMPLPPPQLASVAQYRLSTNSLDGLPPPPSSLIMDDDPLPPPPPSMSVMSGAYAMSNATNSYPPPPSAGLPPVQRGVGSPFDRSLDWIPKVYIEKAVALYDYEAEKPDELTLRENCVVYVLRKNEDGWFEGVLDGCTGLFPGNYVQAI